MCGNEGNGMSPADRLGMIRGVVDILDELAIVSPTINNGSRRQLTAMYFWDCNSRLSDYNGF